MAQKGQWDEAIDEYQKAVALHPNYIDVRNDLGVAFLQKGELEQAKEQFQTALHYKPDYADAQNNLAQVNALLQRTGGVK